jgi:hypothetical protein
MTSAGNTFTSIGARRCEGEPDLFSLRATFAVLADPATPFRPVCDPEETRPAERPETGAARCGRSSLVSADVQPCANRVLTASASSGGIGRHPIAPQPPRGPGRDSERHELASVIIGSVGVRIPPRARTESTRPSAGSSSASAARA